MVRLGLFNRSKTSRFASVPIFTAMLAIILSTALVGGAGMFGMRSITADMSSATERTLPRLQANSDLVSKANQLEALIVMYLTAPLGDQALSERIATHAAVLADDVETLGEPTLTERVSALTDKIDTARALRLKADLFYAFDARPRSTTSSHLRMCRR